MSKLEVGLLGLGLRDYRARRCGLCLCITQRSRGLELSLYGTKGTLENDRVFIKGSEGWERREIPSMKNSFWQDVDYFVSCILGDQSPAVDVREGARNVAACLAGVESARKGKPVAPARF